MSSKKPDNKPNPSHQTLHPLTSGVAKPVILKSRAGRLPYKNRVGDWAASQGLRDLVLSNSDSESSQTSFIHPSPVLVGRKKPKGLNMDAVLLAADNPAAANMRQNDMNRRMDDLFHGPGVAGAAGGVAGAAGGVGDSMDHRNYNLTAPENLGENPSWDEKYAFGKKGGSRKRTKKYTNKRKRKRQTRRKTFRKRK